MGYKNLADKHAARSGSKSTTYSSKHPDYQKGVSHGYMPEPGYLPRGKSLHYGVGFLHGAQGGADDYGPDDRAKARESAKDAKKTLKEEHGFTQPKNDVYWDPR